MHFRRDIATVRAQSTANSSCGNDHDGIEYAVRVGFDKQVHENFVIGLVGEFGKAEINDSVSAFSTTPAYYTMTRDLKYDANIRARVGFTPGTTLFYATGGGAYGRVRNRFSTSNTTNSFSTNGDKNAYGFTAGGGVEQKLGRNISVGLEYLFTDLKDDKARVDVGAGTAGATNPFVLAGGTEFRRNDDHFRYHSMRATVAFRF
jgi:outer membrane immunogenic protein